MCLALLPCRTNFRTARQERAMEWARNQSKDKTIKGRNWEDFCLHHNLPRGRKLAAAWPHRPAGPSVGLRRIILSFTHRKNQAPHTSTFSTANAPHASTFPHPVPTTNQ